MYSIQFRIARRARLKSAPSPRTRESPCSHHPSGLGTQSRDGEKAIKKRSKLAWGPWCRTDELVGDDIQSHFPAAELVHEIRFPVERQRTAWGRSAREPPALAIRGGRGGATVLCESSAQVGGETVHLRALFRSGHETVVYLA